MNKKLVLAVLGILVFGALFSAIVIFQKNKKPVGEEALAPNAPAQAHFDRELNKKAEDFLAKRQIKDEKEQVKKKLFAQFVESPLVVSEFAALNSMMDSQIANIDKLEITKDKKESLMNAFKSIFDAGAIYDSYLNRLYEQFSSDELKELNDVYANVHVAKTISAMQHMRTPDGQKEFGEYLKDLPNKPLSDQRKQQLAKFDELTMMTDNSAKLVNEVMGLVQDAISASAAPKNEAEKKSQVEEQKKLQEYMKSKIHEGVMFTLAKAHTEVSDQEMAEILNVRSKPAALKEGKLRIDNVSDFFNSAKAKQGYDAIVKFNPKEH